MSAMDWLNAEKDAIPHPRKAGLLNGEEYRRTFPATHP